MSRPKLDLQEKIQEILLHVAPLSPTAEVPIVHYQSAANDLLGLWAYLDRKIRATAHYPSVLNRHMDQLNVMILVHLVESLERFFKDLAALCADRLARNVPDDRLNSFSAAGAILAAHMQTNTLGKALFESTLFMNSNQIRERFATLLDPVGEGPTFQATGKFDVFSPYPPVGKKHGRQLSKTSDISRLDTLELLWQIRHTIIHNVGVITQSDALKLRRASGRPVAAPQLLRPTPDDLRYTKQFLDETAREINQRVACRLAHVMTDIHTNHSGILDAQTMANQLAEDFQTQVDVGGASGAP